MINRQSVYQSLKSQLQAAGFQFEREQRPHHQNRREKELKFIHPRLISKWKKEGRNVRAKKFYIKPLSDEPNCEIGFVTGRTSPLHNIFTGSNSFDEFDNTPAWVNKKNDPALDNLLKSIENYLS